MTYGYIQSTKHGVSQVSNGILTFCSLSYLIFRSCASNIQCSFSCSNLVALVFNRFTCSSRLTRLSVELSSVRLFSNATSYGTDRLAGWKYTPSVDSHTVVSPAVAVPIRRTHNQNLITSGSRPL